MKARKTVIQALLHLVLGIATGVVLLSLTYSIPTDEIENHVRKSAMDTIQIEGLYPELTHIATSYLDNWTDSIMLAEAAHPSVKSAVYDAMQVPRFVANEFPDQSLVIWAKTGEYVYEDTYPQYWHGYLIFLKPLFMVMDFSQIRILNGICQTMLSLTMVWLLWKHSLKPYILPWLISVCMLMPLAMAKCMQFSSCYYIFTIASLTLLCCQSSPKRHLIFLWAGIATAYFDFLTYPISTFGIPAVFALIVSPGQKLEKQLKMLAVCFIAWVAGYGLMWGGKLLAGSLITGVNYIREAEGHVGHWFDGERWFSLGRVYYLNVRDFIYTPVSVVAFGFVAVLVVCIIRKRSGFMLVLPIMIPYLILAAMPFLWYLFLFNPSGIHHFFTNKACVVTAFSGMSMLITLLKLNNGSGHEQENTTIQ